jgi:hypothetical protein
MAKLPSCLLVLLSASPLSGQAVVADTEGVQAGARVEMTRFVIDSTGAQTWRPGLGAEAALGITSNLAAFLSYSRATFDAPNEYSVTHADLGARFNVRLLSGLIVPHIDAAIAWRGVDLHDADPRTFGLQGFGTTAGVGLMVYASPRIALGVHAQQTRMHDFIRPVEYQDGELVRVGPYDESSTRVSVSLRYTTAANIGGSSTIAVGDTVRVWDAASVYRATILGLSTDSVQLAIGTDVQTRALRDFHRLESVGRARPLNAAVIGVMAGGIASALFTSVREGSIDEPIWIAGGAVTGGLLGALSAPAQRWRPGTLPLPAAISAAASSRAPVRLHAPAYPVIAGELLHVGADSLLLSTDKLDITYPIAGLREIELRESQSAATIGGIVGAAAGAGIVALTRKDLHGLNYVQGFFIGAAIGGGVGSAIGTQFRITRWTTIYSR